ncbi:uncharacterized protein BO96DRAFT_417519 [Aspergillus niger CBS 101883]|uniref:uncharacterized protein n=1 Tax=Aspergillus lacticoffeatus (strain CBS 101883) TaxID=1450533 RepID=UPI000D7F7EAF|nr:uncharacterized protein BO96DRAFT_417519 [Aspergillus niger CBS 101883]PYH61980.1 hypothetical protein BO96DRAFT_417519 [Aspergillus niger CBS 101883]
MSATQYVQHTATCTATRVLSPKAPPTWLIVSVDQLAPRRSRNATPTITGNQQIEAPEKRASGATKNMPCKVRTATDKSGVVGSHLPMCGITQQSDRGAYKLQQSKPMTSNGGEWQAGSIDTANPEECLEAVGSNVDTVYTNADEAMLNKQLVKLHLSG